MKEEHRERLRRKTADKVHVPPHFLACGCASTCIRVSVNACVKDEFRSVCAMCICLFSLCLFVFVCV